jgi:hypothetical protein
MRSALLLVMAVLCRPGPPGPVPAFDPASAAQFPETRQALALGRTNDDSLFESFNNGYVIPGGEAVERAEIITEFRRAVLLVREKYNIGEFGMTERDLAKAMVPHEGLVTFVAEAKLHPLHTYAKVPPYELYIETGPRTKPLASQSVRRDPVYPPGLGFGTSFVGVRLEGAFRRADVEAAPAPMLVVTDEHANVVWQARIDLSRYR